MHTGENFSFSTEEALDWEKEKGLRAQACLAPFLKKNFYKCGRLWDQKKKKEALHNIFGSVSWEFAYTENFI